MNIIVPKVEQVADFGAEEPFVARIFMGLSEVLDATEFEEKEKIKESVMGIFINGLLPAFSYLRELRDIESGKKERLVVDLNKAYVGFYDRLWVAYKDQMQKVIKLLDFDLGFIFKDDKKFEKGCKEFVNNYPNIRVEFIEQIKKNRIAWQTQVARFRNDYSQHQSIYEDDVREMLSLKTAEVCFENCWTLIEFILAHLMCTKLYPWVRIEEIPKEKRDSSAPKKFKILYKI